MLSECGLDGQDCGASQAQIAYETQRYYYENCSSGYAGGCPNYGEVIAFTTGGLIISGAILPVVDSIGVVVADAIATGTSTVCADLDCGNEVNYVIKAADQLKKEMFGRGLQVHHIIEKRLAPALGQTVSSTRKWLSVALTPEQHRLFTNAWREAIGYSKSNNLITTENATIEVVWAAAQKIYVDFPTILEAAKQTIFGK